MTARRSILLAPIVAVVAFFGFTSAAGAVDNPDYGSPVPPAVTVPNPPADLPAAVERTPASPATPAGEAASASAQARTSSNSTATASSRQTLAITGSDTTGFVVIGALLLAAGGGLLLLRRRVVA